MPVRNAPASAVSEHEHKLIREIVAGKTDEFHHLVVTHQAQVYGLVLRQVGEDDIAQELTQEIFVKAYVSLERFRFESSFLTWLTRIALNHVSAYFSSRACRNARLEESFDLGVHDIGDPAEEQNRKELLQHFLDALSELPPNLRDVISLCALEDRSYEETAAILGIPLGTVRSRLSKARARLKRIFIERWGSDEKVDG